MENLAEILRKFYPSARQKNDNNDGKGLPNAKQSLINIRSAINWYLQLPPHNKTWDLVKDSEFKAANITFKGIITLLTKV